MRDIIIICDDLFGLEVYSILAETNRWLETMGQHKPFHILGYISNTERPFGDLGPNLQCLGDIDHWEPSKDEWYVMGIKMPERKKAIAEKMKAKGCRFATVYVPWMLAPPIQIGEGSIVAAYAIFSGMVIGDFVTIIGAMFSHHRIGDYSTIMRFANIAGDIGECSYIGNHAYTHFEKNVGDHCFIEDGSIVVNHVKDGVHVAGVPARKIRR